MVEQKQAMAGLDQQALVAVLKGRLMQSEAQGVTSLCVQV